MRLVTAVRIFAVLVILGLFLRVCAAAQADTPAESPEPAENPGYILVCMPYPVDPKFAADGWQLVNSGNHPAVAEMVRNKLAEVVVVEAGSCAPFNQDGHRLAKPIPVSMIFWRKGVAF